MSDRITFCTVMQKTACEFHIWILNSDKYMIWEQPSKPAQAPLRPTFGWFRVPKRGQWQFGACAGLLAKIPQITLIYTPLMQLATIFTSVMVTILTEMATILKYKCVIAHTTKRCTTSINLTNNIILHQYWYGHLKSNNSTHQYNKVRNLIWNSQLSHPLY